MREAPGRDSVEGVSDVRKALVTGATGYIGGRLVPRLLDAGFQVRVLVRNPDKLRDVPWADRVEVAQGDLGDPESLRAATEGVDVLYYLVHSMGGKGDFEQIERESAQNVADAAAAAGVKRIVYLGGLHPQQGELSPHLRSRVEVGRILLDSGVPTAALQAGVVIGSGSTSFEMIRHLTEVLPYMPAPKWVRNHIQPIAVRDVLHYLIGSAELPDDVNRTFDIGGPDVLRYGQMMNGYALEAGLKQRPIAALPVLTPWLASQWVNLVTPIPRALAMPIIASLQFDCVTHEHDIRDYVPDPEGGLTPYRRAVRLALGKMKAGEVETSWQDGFVEGAASDPLPSDPDWAGHTVYLDIKQRKTDAPAEALWTVIEGIGGQNGWYSFPLAWAVRGWMDKLVGGVGLRRGRRSATRLNTGDALDFWRVEQIDRGSFLRLRAEMRVPGRAWLEMRATPAPGGGSVYDQRAIFFPRGLGGRLYWFAILPFHGVIFNGMANRITETALASGEPAPRLDSEESGRTS
ncbi:SDR family oxidoreductase [Herbiconiux sp. KACC 21604]|uniref:SDR family oxidoreductase n=1 Tax=unclassified Herbiconiux TaxID=2618217 RepID=UPI0014922F98|nr:SDR family oxidoreductase [Herbiconiux sp. SALV-R1]QJU53750.1 SDR family oxidoreductase [Herbiconiux sp. SALV-R1]WPO84754.1 SDR family oxidoreductase [Herbiconiux sp. KACC 21604]